MQESILEKSWGKDSMIFGQNRRLPSNALHSSKSMSASSTFITRMYFPQLFSKINPQKKARKPFTLEWNMESSMENINMEVQESLNFMVFLTDVSGSSYKIEMLNFNSTQPMVRMICKQPGFLTVQLFSAKTISSRIAFSLEFWNVSTKHHSNDVGRSRQPLIIFKRRSCGTVFAKKIYVL